jgi:hypothetical protein
MNNLPFGKPGKFWRGNLHAHTVRSDGKQTPEAMCQHYKQAGYDFLAITDHFMPQWNYPVTDTTPFRETGFLTLIGAEIPVSPCEFATYLDLLAIGLPFDFQPQAEGETKQDFLNRLTHTGAFLAVCHPACITLTEKDIMELQGVHAIEIANGNPTFSSDRWLSWQLADLLLARGHRYTAVANDDAHTFSDSQVSWNYVKAANLTEAAIIAALKAGDFYTSTGAQIHDVQVIRGECIRVACSPASNVTLSGVGWNTVPVIGHRLTRVELPLKGFNSPFGRITVSNEFGQFAWTNPFWFD